MVLKLGLLGDIIMCLDEFAYIRKLHPKAHITLLTRPAYAEFMQSCPAFDEVVKDPLPKKITEIIKQNRNINAQKYDMIYSLKKSLRSKRYLFMVGSKTVRKLVLPHGFKADKAWLRKADVAKLELPESYVVIVPGCTPHRLMKRWEPKKYGELCKEITRRGFSPVIIGTKQEASIAEEIIQICPEAISLIDKTTTLELTTIIANAKAVIGNDTGPIHIGHYMEVKTMALISKRSKFLQEYYKEKHFNTLFSADLQDLSVQEVVEHLPF